MAEKETKETKQRMVTIAPPNLKVAIFEIEGSAPYVQSRFSAKAMKEMADKMAAGSTAAKGKKRPPRDFEADYQGAHHFSTEGWIGIPASCFRNALISACRLVGFKMTLGKLSVFVLADGFDKIDGIPLVKIQGTPRKHIMPARNDNGSMDLRVRPMWEKWGAKVRVRYDADQFTIEDVTNLMSRVGLQVGIGEGRPDSRMSAGIGWGTFDLAGTVEAKIEKAS